MYLIAHLSDTHFGYRAHIDGGVRSAERVARVMAYLANLAQPVDVVLVTGDIADHGLPAEYDEARKALGCTYPMLMCPGNHDERRAYRRHLLGDNLPADNLAADSLSADSGSPINHVETVGGVTFAMCDSSIPGEDSGFLGDDTLDWLDRVLAGPPGGGGPAFVCFHHPPVSVQIPMIDAIRQHGERRLAAVLERHPRVIALLCGHVHSAAASTFAGRPLLVAPGVASTLRLPWECGGVMDFEQPPGIAFHVLDDDRRLTTHYRVIV